MISCEGKGIRASSASTPQTVQVTATWGVCSEEKAVRFVYVGIVEAQDIQGFGTIYGFIHLLGSWKTRGTPVWNTHAVSHPVPQDPTQASTLHWSHRQ